jgi:transmembrane sensor
MTDQNFGELIDGYLTGSLSSEEKAKLALMLQQPEYIQQLEKHMQQRMELGTFTGQEDERVKHSIMNSIRKEIGTQRRPAKVLPIRRLFAVASVILLLLLATWLLVGRGGNSELVSGTEADKQNIQPGKQGAILTLANGKQIVLDSAADGHLTAVAIKKGNQLSYHDAATAKVEMNTMITPKGRQYSLVLADGTQVWLNAASSITYPTAFQGNERKVVVTGEVYFEVKKQHTPFLVESRGVVTKVLGTHFNVNAYEDEEDIRVTLLEGSVQVALAQPETRNPQPETLKPGEQAIVAANTKPEIRNNIDLDAVMAWKNGYFSFDQADIRTVMRQLERWYNIEVLYEGENAERYSGKIGRGLNLQDLLEGLGKTRVRYRIEESRRLVILP